MGGVSQFGDTRVVQSLIVGDQPGLGLEVADHIPTHQPARIDERIDAQEFAICAWIIKP